MLERGERGLNRGFTVIGKCRSLCVETHPTYDVIIFEGDKIFQGTILLA